ncbi:MAG TPA: hypothetical protein VH590_05845 [Ktedonobacterales bacterium]|jgi:ABC-type nitrate/sulfonate/bicarbonate transport system substrate-binding protein
MSQDDPLAVVLAWQEAANAPDIDRLIALSDANIEIGGPRSSGFGHQLLRDWMARAGLTLETLRAFVRGETVALEQRGVWRALETGAVTGDRILASVFHVKQGRVICFARYDRLDAALEAAGLNQSDERAVTT